MLFKNNSSVSPGQSFSLIDPLTFLSLTIILYILRMVGPYINYIFIPFLFFFFLYMVVRFKNNYKLIDIGSILKAQRPLLIITFLFFLGYFLSSSFIFFAFKELLNAFILVFISISLFMIVNDRAALHSFTRILCKYFIIFSSIISLLGITKFILQLYSFDNAIQNFSGVITGTSLNTDYNYYSLFSFIGLISLLFNYSKIKRISYISIFILLNVNILLSGSRRGIIVLIIFWMILILYGFKFELNLKRIVQRLLIVIVVLATIFSILFSIRNLDFKKQSNQSVDIIPEVQLRIQYITSYLMYRYLTLFDSEASYSEINKSLWTDKNLFGSKINYNKYSQSNGTKNLLYNGDFKYGLLFWDPGANATRHEIVKTPFGNGIRVTRYDGDNASWPLLYTGRPIIYYAGHSYNIRFKFKVERGNELPFNVGWWVNDGNQGYIAHALPLSIKSLDGEWKEADCTYKFKETHYDLLTFLNSLEDYSVVDITNVELRDLNRIDSIPLFVDQILPTTKLVQSVPEIAVLKNETKSTINSAYAPRLDRWNYCWIIYSDSLSKTQKIYGGGFDYLKMIGAKFGETKIDDPHNPFISAFLYSGLVGGVLYFLFMGLVFYYYLIYIKEHLFYFICFLLIFFFSFVSANTHFSIPVYSIFCIQPFLTRYIIQYEQANEAKLNK